MKDGQRGEECRVCKFGTSSIETSGLFSFMVVVLLTGQRFSSFNFDQLMCSFKFVVNVFVLSSLMTVGRGVSVIL